MGGVVLKSVQDTNQAVFNQKNDASARGAYDVVSMAAAISVQNEMEMHANFEAMSNAALAVAMKQLAKDAAEENVEGAAKCTEIIASITKARDLEVANIEKFNTMVEKLVKSFPKGTG